MTATTSKIKWTKQVSDLKVLINYSRNGVSVSQSLYTGPHKKHADKAYQTACTLARHGVLTDCTITYFDGFRLRQDWERTAESLKGN